MYEKFIVLNPHNNSPYEPWEPVPAAEIYRQLRNLKNLRDRRHYARIYGTHRFPWDCPLCGKETAHSTRDDECLRCRRAGNRKPRAVAREKGLTKYRAECPTHGETDFHVSVGKCAHCYNAVGVPRVRPVEKTARAIARRDGVKTYMASCPGHGEVEHYVHLGKCALCYTSMGSRRARWPVALEPPPEPIPVVGPFDLANALMRAGMTIDQLASAAMMSPDILIELMRLPAVPEPQASYLDALIRRLT